MEAEVEVVGSGGWGFMELWVVRGGCRTGCGRCDRRAQQPAASDGEGADSDGAECCVRRLSWFQSQVWTVEEDRGDRD